MELLNGWAPEFLVLTFGGRFKLFFSKLFLWLFSSFQPSRDILYISFHKLYAYYVYIKLVNEGFQFLLATLPKILYKPTCELAPGGFGEILYN